MLCSDWLNDALFGIFNYGTFGGKDFIDSLNYHNLDARLTNNSFSYVLGGNLLSYVIMERTRMTPEEFAKTRIFPKLGITEDDYMWQKNRDGVSYGWHGLFMTVRAMAKLGMLYLQKGHSSATDTIVEEDFLLDSTRGTDINPGYGYNLWIVDEDYPNPSTRHLAAGFGSNIVYVDETLGRVMALTSNNFVPALAGGEIDNSAQALMALVSDPTCSFQAV